MLFRSYLIGQRKLSVLDSEYADAVKMRILIPQEEAAGFKEEVTEGTSARVSFSEEEEVLFAFANGEPLFFEP